MSLWILTKSKSLVLFLNLIKAIAIAIAFLFLPLSVAQKMSLKDIQQLALKGQRKQAAVRLKAKIAATKNEATKKNLIQALREFSRVFYTDKAQKLFQLSESMYFSKDGHAESKLKKVLALEPYNVIVLKASVRLSLRASRCNNAKSTIESIIEIDPYDQDIVVLTGLTSLCYGRSQYRLNKKNRKHLAESLSPQATLVLARYIFEIEQRSVESMKWVQKAISQDKSFPESYWVKWKVSQQLKPPQIEDLQNYVKLCKAISHRSLRYYLNTPGLCLQLSEAEKVLKAELAKSDIQKNNI